jgi:hypothetical protein
MSSENLISEEARTLTLVLQPAVFEEGLDALPKNVRRKINERTLASLASASRSEGLD